MQEPKATKQSNSIIRRILYSKIFWKFVQHIWSIFFILYVIGLIHGWFISFVAILPALMSVGMMYKLYITSKMGMSWFGNDRVGNSSKSATTKELTVPLPVDLKPFRGLVKTLFEGNPSEKIEAAKALERYGHEAVQPLLLTLDDVDASVRAQATTSLGLIGDARAVLPLVQMLSKDGWFLGFDSGQITALEQIAGGQSLALKVIGSRHMLPAERLNTLEVMLKYRKSFEIGRQPSLPQYCRELMHRSDMVVEVRIGAKEVLELMERRAGTQSLLRPAEPVLETATLLRPASNDPYATPTEQLLRVAEDENEPGTNNDKNAGP